MTKSPTYLNSTSRVFACRVSKATPYLVDEIAADLGYYRIDLNFDRVGNVGAMLDAIAKGELWVVPAENKE